MNSINKCFLAAILFFIALACNFGLLQGGNSNDQSKVKNFKAENMKPSIFFEDLQLRQICEPEEWIAQFRPIRTKWTKCLGFLKVFLPTERNGLKRSTLKLLKKFQDVGDESLNPYCRLSRNWRACVHYLRDAVPCLVSNYDVIQRAKDPKYTPIRRKRITTGSPAAGFTTSRFTKEEDDLDHQAELFQIECEAMRLTQQYRQDNVMMNMVDDFDENNDWEDYERTPEDPNVDDFEDPDDPELKKRKKKKKQKEEL